MIVLNFYLFDKQGACLFYHEWSRSNNPFIASPEEDRKLVFGLLFSLKQFAQKLSPEEHTKGLKSLSTPSYTLHHFESVTGYRFVLNTVKIESVDLQDELHGFLGKLYSEVFVPLVVMNPVHPLGSTIDVPAFQEKLLEYVSAVEHKISLAT